MQPVFIFSLPRSGSTLLQRLIAAHPEVSTASEPWVLMPFLYALKPSGVFAEYGHEAAQMALDDFIRTLPGGREDYSAALREFALTLYAKAAQPDTHYFLDKTPRYHLIASEILALFPDGRFVFLWRNPLAVAASVIDTFGCGRWNIFEFKVDLYQGIENLIEAHAGAGKRAISLRYEDLIKDTESALKDICAYMQIPYDTGMKVGFTQVALKGRLGDYTGTREFSSISNEPLDKWKKVLKNPLRKRWARKWLKWIGRERLAVMGYSYDELLAELNSVPFSLSNLIPDMFRSFCGLFSQFFEFKILRRKLSLLKNWRKAHILG